MSNELSDALYELRELREKVKELEEENFKLAAGQCVIDNGIISGEFGHTICPKEYNK